MTEWRTRETSPLAQLWIPYKQKFWRYSLFVETFVLFWKNPQTILKCLCPCTLWGLIVGCCSRARVLFSLLLCDFSLPTLSTALWTVWPQVQSQPAGIREEQSRIYTHKSDRCIVCHYLPLIIILLLLFIPWTTLAVFPGWLTNICAVALQSDRCSWEATRLLLWFLPWLCVLESGHLTFRALEPVLAAVCVLLSDCTTLQLCMCIDKCWLN